MPALGAKSLPYSPGPTAELSGELSTWEAEIPCAPEGCDGEGTGLTVPSTGALVEAGVTGLLVWARVGRS